MTLALTQSLSAVAANITSSFLGVGGTPAYTYSVIPGGAGGTINASTGVYTAPIVASSDPKFAYDTIRVTDSLAATATAQILVGTPLILFCDILRHEMGLAADQVYLWDQKIFELTDSRPFIAVSVPICKPFGNISSFTSEVSGLNQNQAVNMMAQVDIDIISRGPAARDRKEEIILALNSVYAEQQMEANSFYIGRISKHFINLSYVDGAAIPYRYKISCQMQYLFNKVQAAQYFDTFSEVEIVEDTI